jgi:mono/diheme cytochrome c family protein
MSAKAASAAIGALAGVALLTAPIATAQKRTPVERGRAIAEAKCAGCHAVAGTGRSPRAEAPPLRELPTRYPVEHLAEAFAEGIVVGHPDMPQFTFDPPDIDALLSYLQSLAPRKASPAPKR